MATRAGGTGTLVSLVIFVIATVALLVFSVIMWRNQALAEENADAARRELARVARSADLQRDEVKRLQAEASKRNLPLVAYMLEEAQDAAGFVTGDRNRALTDLARPFGIRDEDAARTSLRTEWERLRAELAQVKAAQAATDQRNQDLLKQMEAMRAETDRQIAAKEEELRRVQASISGYRDAAEGYRKDVADAVTGIQESKDRIEQTYRGRLGDLQQQIDALNAERDLLKTRNNELGRKLAAFTVRAPDPSTLVDGRVIEVNSAEGVVFLDIGRNDRVQPGMTFEVYETPEAIQFDDRTGQTTRGKASIQVIRVADNTATARVTRGSTARPVVKGDVLVNAVFQPGMKYKFLVFGKFDVDGDGRVTSEEADFVRSRIREWGGEVIDGDSLTGDLDFLILGQQPPMPTPLPIDVTDAQMRAYIDARAAREIYDKLFNDAVEAQIPVLNWNRFQVLTGQGIR
ncbi:MAG: hypothetical protein KF724_04620 [Phycisphaeraceae bacterium]|nr:hypothetical protein [Phycisphaeraceae bacterium]